MRRSAGQRPQTKNLRMLLAGLLGPLVLACMTAHVAGQGALQMAAATAQPDRQLTPQTSSCTTEAAQQLTPPQAGHTAGPGDGQAPPGFTLIVSVVGAGSVWKEPDKSVYNGGDVVTLSAVPAPGWRFSGFDIPSPVIFIDKNITVVATFSQAEYELTVKLVGSGSVSKDPDKATYYYGDIVTLSAIASPGWSFSGFGPGASVTVQGPTIVAANFTLDEYSLEVETVGSGSVTRDPDRATYHYGDEVTLVPTPAAGWSFGTFTEASPITIKTDTTVVATFSRDDGLKAYWPFDEGQGGVASDACGGMSARVSGAQWLPGKSGTALSFDGVDDFVTLGSSGALSAPQELTVLLWVWLQRQTVEAYELLTKPGAYTLYLYQKGTTPKAMGSVTAGGVTNHPQGASELSYGKWCQVGFVVGPIDASGTRKIGNIVDGRVTSSASLPVSIDVTDSPLVLNPRHLHRVVVDDLRVYTRALSPEAIRAVYLSQLSPEEAAALGRQRSPWVVSLFGSSAVAIGAASTAVFLVGIIVILVTVSGSRRQNPKG